MSTPHDVLAAARAATAAALSTLDPAAAAYLVRKISPAFARLEAIETAACQVLATGQARYDAEEVYAGDQVPAAAMSALRVAVEGGADHAGSCQVGSEDRCEWCGQEPYRGMPQPPVRVHIRLDGATDDEVARLLPTLPGWLAAVQVDPLPERFTTDGSRSISVRRRDVTMEQYCAEADAWLERERG